MSVLSIIIIVLLIAIALYFAAKYLPPPWSGWVCAAIVILFVLWVMFLIFPDVLGHRVRV
jgi:hypothetical protein